MKESSEKEKCKVARPNDKAVVGARVIYKRKMEGGKVEKYRCRRVVEGFWQGEGVHHSPTLATA